MPRKPKLKVEFVKELPPKASNGNAGRPSSPLLAEYADILRGKPGVWALYPKSVTRNGSGALAANINSATSKYPFAFRGTDFQAKVRNGVIHVRFNPNREYE